jgi:CheY-like chemotaxis protein
MQNVLIVMEKNGFLGRTTGDKLKEYGYNPVLVELSMKQLSKLEGAYEAMLLFMEDDDADEKIQELVFLRDKAIEENIPVFYMGDSFDSFDELIPKHVLKESFQRPIDVNQVALKIDEFIKNHGSHIKKKILVVDDSGAMLRNIKGWLEDRYQVILANSGAMAIKYLAINRPDLVLLDYEMPVVDGRQVLGMIRSETEFCDIPVIFLTGKNDRESIVKVMELKPEGYLLKSMEPSEIVMAIDSFFEKRRLG